MVNDASIVVLGTGDMGGAIAEALALRTSHPVRVRGARPGSRSAAALVAAHPQRLCEATDAELREAGVVFVVVPWDALDAPPSALTETAAIVVSVVVPWTASGDPRRDLTSAAERIAMLAPRARVVNAFTSVPSTFVREPPPGDAVTVFVCGDDDDAVRRVMRLAADLGFDAVHAGALRDARYAEGLGLLWASLVERAGVGERISFRLVRSPSSPRVSRQ